MSQEEELCWWMLHASYTYKLDSLLKPCRAQERGPQQIGKLGKLPNCFSSAGCKINTKANTKKEAQLKSVRRCLCWCEAEAATVFTRDWSNPTRKTTELHANTPKEESSPRLGSMWPALLTYKTLIKPMFFFPSNSTLPCVLFSSLEAPCQQCCPSLTVLMYLNVSHYSVHVWRQVWRQPQMSFLGSHPPCFLRQCRSLARGWLIRLGWLAREPPENLCQYLTSSGITSINHHTWLCFYCEL